MRELTAVEAIWLVMGRELRAQRISFLSWLVPLAGLVAMMVSIQPQAAGQNGLLEAKLAMMPETLKQAFNLVGTDFSKPAGYLSTNFITVTMGATIFAGLLGASVVSREDAQRTAEAVLTLPVTRWQVLLGKGLTVVSLLVAFHAVLMTVTVATLVSVVPGDRQLELVAAMYVDSTSNRAYEFGGVSVAMLFGGVMPPTYDLFVTHSTGVNLHATGGNHSLNYERIQAQTV